MPTAGPATSLLRSLTAGLQIPTPITMVYAAQTVPQTAVNRLSAPSSELASLFSPSSHFRSSGAAGAAPLAHVTTS